MMQMRESLKRRCGREKIVTSEAPRDGESERLWNLFQVKCMKFSNIGSEFGYQDGSN